MIPVSDVLLDGNELNYVTDCITSGWISSVGTYTNEFERRFAEWHGRKFALTVSNGTAALEVALHGLGIKPGDEVILPNLTIISCFSAIVRLGAIPICIDSSPEDWNIDVSLIEDQITNKTRAIMAVDLFGMPANFHKVYEIAKKYGLRLIEDAAEAIGGQIGNRMCGSFGDVSTFSLFANKNITAGEGGVILTDCPEIYRRCSSYKNLYFGEVRDYRHEDLGFNYRMSNIHAAIALAQLENIDEKLNIKISNANLYHSLMPLEAFRKYQKEQDDKKCVYWMYAFEMKSDLNIDAATMIKELERCGIQARRLFCGLVQQPIYKKLFGETKRNFYESELAYRNGFYLPSGLCLTNEQISEVCSAVSRIING